MVRAERAPAFALPCNVSAPGRGLGKGRIVAFVIFAGGGQVGGELVARAFVHAAAI